MKSKVEFVRERPLGMIPFSLGVLVLGAVVGLLAAGIEGPPAAWLSAGGFGVAMVAIGVTQFHRPHRLELAGDAVLISGRFGAPRRWPSVRLKQPAPAGLVALEVAAVVGALGLVAFAMDRATPAQLVVAAVYAHAYARWRLAPRVVATDAGGHPTTVRVDGLPGAVEAITGLEAAPVAVRC